MKHRSTQWELTTPDAEAAMEPPKVVLATVHPRGDQRILKCIQSLLNSRVRVHVIWLAEKASETHFDAWLSETCVTSELSTKARITRTLKVIQRAQEVDAEILYVHDYYMLPHASWWKRQQDGRKVVFDSHEYYPHLYSEKAPRGMRVLARVAIELLSRLLFRSVDAFSLVSRDMLTPSVRKGRPSIETPNFPSRWLFPRASSPACLDRMTRVIHTGSLTRAYGADLLIEAAAIIQARNLPIQIDAVERFPSDSERKRFHAELKRMGNPSTLRMIPARPANEVQGLLEGYGVGLSMIQKGGQNHLAVPTKVYEYATVGLVVVSTDLPAQKRFIDRSPAVVGASFDAKSPEALVDTLDRMRSSTEIVSGLTEAAEAARATLNWDSSCAPLFVMFRRLIPVDGPALS